MSSSVATLPSRSASSSNLAPPELGAGGASPRLSSWPSLLAALWLTGALLASLRPLIGLWGIARLSQGSDPVSDAPTRTLASECASALGLTGMPALRQADAPVPMTWGWRHPVVLLPTGAQNWPEDRLRAVLLHELAHVRRRDWLSHRLADCVCALYWFHPFVWLTARRLRAEGEIACDDLVLTSGVAAPDYARHLLDVARALRPASAVAVPQAAIAMARTSQIEGRLKMILDTTRSRRALTRRVMLLALTPGAAALVTLAMLRLDAQAQAAPTQSNAPPPAVAPAKPRTVFPLAPGMMVTRYFISPGHPYRLMKKQGHGNPVVWDKSQPALLPAAGSPQVKLKAVLPLKPVSAAPRRPVVRLAQQSPAAPTPVKLPRGPYLVQPVPAAPAPTSVPASPSDNVSLQLVGMTDGSDKWWSSSGALLPQPLYDPAAYHSGQYDYWRKAFASGKPRLDFAFRVSPASAKDVTLRFSLESPNISWSSTSGTWQEKMQGQDQQTEAQLNSHSGGLRVLSVVYSSAPTPRPITVTVASGPWTVAATGHVSTAGPAQNFGAHVYFFSQLFQADGKSRVIISTNDTENDVRVVAVDAQGREVLPVEIGDSSTSAMSQISVLFALPAAQIKELRVETRPFRQVEFKDIALQPAK